MLSYKNTLIVRAILRSRLVGIAFLVLLIWAIAGFIYSGADATGYRWQWRAALELVLAFDNGIFVPGPLLGGLYMTFQVSICAILLSLVFGFVAAQMQVSPFPAFRAVAGSYVRIVRNVPLLVLLYLFYFILSPVYGMDRFWTGVICLAFFEGAFVAEILRGGFSAISKGQSEASHVLRLSKFQTLRYVVGPQAMMIILPPLAGQLVNLVKHSAILTVISLNELTNVGRLLISQTFMSFELWTLIAALYLLVTVSLALGVSYIENKCRFER